MSQFKRFENIHIAFWLIKDMCWLIGFKTMGLIMVIPTISLAINIVYKARHTVDMYIKLAVLAWITANSIFMLSEFYGLWSKMYGLPFFIFGIIMYGVFIYKTKGSLF